MKHAFRRILAVGTAIVSILAAGLLSACDSSTPKDPNTPDTPATPVTYSVKVNDKNGFGIHNVKVVLFNEKDKEVYSGLTNNNGKVTCDLPGITYSVKIDSAEYSYERNEKGYFTTLATAEAPSLVIPTTKLYQPSGAGTWQGLNFSPFQLSGEGEWVITHDNSVVLGKEYFELNLSNNKESDPKPGRYAISVECYSATIAQHAFGMGNDSSIQSVKTPKMLELEIGTIYLKTPFIFSVQLDHTSDLEPKYRIKVSYVGAIQERPEPIVTKINPEQIDLVKGFANQPQTGEITSLLKDNSLYPKVSLGQDGLYRVKAADGTDRLLMLKITYAKNEEPSDSNYPITQFDIKGGFSYLFDATPAADLADLTKPLIKHDYRLFIRGFEEYEIKEITPPTTEGGSNGGSDSGNPGTNPGGIHDTHENVPPPMEQRQGEFYEKYANADGMIPVTQELKRFLEFVVQQAHVDTDLTDSDSVKHYDPDVLWTYYCCYYA